MPDITPTQKTWSTEELNRDFIPTYLDGDYLIAERRSDGRVGTLVLDCVDGQLVYRDFEPEAQSEDAWFAIAS